MKLLFLISLCLSSLLASAVEPYQLKSNGESAICDDTYLELDNLPPVLDQGRFGLCYAHSSALLLEYLRCGHSNNPSECYANRGSVLNIARFNNYTQSTGDMITMGGDAGTLLGNFADIRKVAKESCAEYDDWKNLDTLHRDDINHLYTPDKEKDEVDYFYYIFKKLKLSASYDQKMCWAQEIVDSGVHQSIQDVMNILNDSIKDPTWRELRYKILVPKQCMNDPVSYPDYDILKYPGYDQRPTFKGFRDKIYQTLKAGHPVEASFCSSKNSDGSCNFHSTSIVGQRHVCDRSGCELQWRIQNSYGKSWQNYNDNGWVNAKNFADLMSIDDMGITMIVPHGEKLNKNLSLNYYENSPINNKAEQVRLSSRGKVPSGPTDKCWLVDSNAYNYSTNSDPVPGDDSNYTPTVINNTNYIPSPSPAPKPGKKNVMYVCKSSDGSSAFSDHPMPGMSCKESHY